MSGIVINILIGVLGACGVFLLIRAKIREARSGGCNGNCSACNGCRKQKHH